MGYLLDTNILSDLIRNPFGPVAQRIEAVGAKAVCTSIIVAAELRYGSAKKGSPRLQARVEDILATIPVLPLEVPADADYGRQRAQLEASGQRKDAIQVMDQGFAHFEASASIWPQAIAFYGQTQGWAQAQALAQSCRERFGSLAPETTACNTAAATPEERAAAQRKTDEKADQLVKKLFNKN